MGEVIDVQLVNITKRFGTLEAVKDVSFEVPRGSFFSILGPSGSGKTTTLKVIAGFEEPDEGEIFIGGQRMNGVPPNHRPVNMVFQQLALFPLMTVFDNVAFGLKMAKVPRNERAERVKAILKTVGLEGFENRKPGQLSGGQQQRVAIARSLVLEPTVLLLDEPLGALDLKLREHMKIELKRLQNEVGTTFVYITHDQSEALVMSDRVAVMNEGRLLQVGAPDELYSKPVDPFVATFVGENNEFRGPVTRLEDDRAVFTVGGRELYSPLHPGVGVGDGVLNYVRPERMRLLPADSAAAQDGPLNQLRGQIQDVVFDGAVARTFIDLEIGQQVTVMVTRAADVPLPRRGEQVRVGWNLRDIICFPAKD